MDHAIEFSPFQLGVIGIKGCAKHFNKKGWFKILPFTLYPVPVTLYPLSSTLYPLPVTLYLLPVTRYPLPFILYPLPFTSYPLPFTRYPLPFTLYPLPFTRYPLPFTLYPLPFILYPLPFTLYPLSSTLYPLPFVFYPWKSTAVSEILGPILREKVSRGVHRFFLSWPQLTLDVKFTRALSAPQAVNGSCACACFVVVAQTSFLFLTIRLRKNGEREQRMTPKQGIKINHIRHFASSYVSRTRVNGPVRVLCKPRIIFLL